VQVGNNCESLVMNALHLPMFAPYNGTFMHAWSLAVQYHAYLWLPLVWRWLRLGDGVAAGGGRRWLLFLVALEVVTTAVRVMGQWHQAQFVKDTVSAGALELFWYSNGLARMHTIVLGMAAAWAARHTRLIEALRSNDAAVRATHAFLGVLAPMGFMLATLNWIGWFGDYRYEHGAPFTAFIVLLAVGGLASAVLWCYAVLAAVHRLGVFGTIPALPFLPSISTLLSHRWLRVLADLSYWSYLIHPAVMNTLYRDPALLYPPSAVDAAPASLLAGAPVALSNASFVPSGPLAGAVHWWAGVRSTLLPEGQPLTEGGLVLLTVAAMVATYAVAAVALWGLEPWMRAAFAATGRWGQRLVWWYSMAILAVGLLGHLSGTYGVVARVTPDIERTIEAMLADKAAAAATAGGGSGGMPA
jgi:peptidoglycan/LPS O-acetylase OafA/YrhL